MYFLKITFNPLARLIALSGLRTRNTRRILIAEILSELRKEVKIDNNVFVNVFIIVLKGNRED